MSQVQKQSDFARAFGLLLQFIYFSGYHVTFGDAWSQDYYKGSVVCPHCFKSHTTDVKGPHRLGSFHPKRLAIDLNLFDKDFNYLTSTEDHRPFGEFWKSLGGTWGGDFRNHDGNHYSWGEN